MAFFRNTTTATITNISTETDEAMITLVAGGTDLPFADIAENITIAEEFAVAAAVGTTA